MYQHITIVGNLGNDPEQRFTPSGQAVTQFSVATNHTYNTADGQHVKEVTWWRVSVWGKQAEACSQYLKKGSMVLVEGRMTPDKETGSPKVWTTKDGKTGAAYELNASNVRFLSKVAESTQATMDEIPF